jgi:carbonic anhydrase/acetyltransferase-like protein (isoleucine patch superfamily)
MQHEAARRLSVLAGHVSAPHPAVAAGSSPASDVDAVMEAFANGARGSREDVPDELDTDNLPQYPQVPLEHYLMTAPRIDPTAFVAPSAELIGACVIGADANVWFGTILRADDEPIIVGEGSNVQDGCILHIDPGNPLIIGKNVTVGHGAILHGCVVEDNAMVAIGAKVLTGARIGRGSVIGAGAIVMEGTQIPPYSVCFGIPAKVVRTMERDGPGGYIAAMYERRGKKYKAGEFLTQHSN